MPLGRAPQSGVRKLRVQGPVRIRRKPSPSCGELATARHGRPRALTNDETHVVKVHSPTYIGVGFGARSLLSQHACRAVVLHPGAASLATGLGLSWFPNLDSRLSEIQPWRLRLVCLRRVGSNASHYEPVVCAAMGGNLSSPRPRQLPTTTCRHQRRLALAD